MASKKRKINNDYKSPYKEIGIASNQTMGGQKKVKQERKLILKNTGFRGK